MSDGMIDEKPLKNAKERQYRTVVYSHECPYCGDPCDDYDVSVIGRVLDCVCGEKYEVAK